MVCFEVKTRLYGLNSGNVVMQETQAYRKAKVMPLPNDSAAQGRFARKAEQILTGATQVFLQRGYERASMDKVAKASGVSKQTLYSHFADKEALFVALVDRMSRRRLEDSFGSQPLKGEPKQVLSSLARATLLRSRSGSRSW